MTLGFNADQVLAITAVLTLVGGAIVTVVGAFLHLKDEAQQREMTRVQDGLKAAWLKIDQLQEEKSAYWTRNEHEAWRKEMREDIHRDIGSISDQVMKELEGRRCGP